MPPFSIIERPGPLIVAAIHAGHSLRADVVDQMALSDDDRLREEDPATDRIAEMDATTVIVFASRFEVDLNRPREGAVYLTPEQAWGLHVWHDTLAEESLSRSLATYDRFYEEMRSLIERKIVEHGFALVLDVHSYNHRRGGPYAPADDPEMNPGVNLGTGTLDRAYWAPVIDAFVDEFSSAGFDMRENVKFRGGEFARWVHATFPRTAVALAVEFKKTFMDEWSAEVDDAEVARSNRMLKIATAAATQAAARMMAP